ERRRAPAPILFPTRRSSDLGDVGVLADMAVQLGHEALAEPHDLGVAAALRVEVGAALAAADRHAGERVLERLLEPEELDDPEVRSEEHTSELQSRENLVCRL